MIAYLKGTLVQKQAGSAVIDIQGVGYAAEISVQTFDALPKEGAEVKLLIHHHITDSDQRLFGFITADEKELFELLITVKGVGPKLGLTILSGMPAPRIIAAIVQSDRGALSQISGIGKKTAERMILELKDKMAEYASEVSLSDDSGGNGALRDEAVSALESLGFRKRDAEKAVQAATQEKEPAGDVQSLVKKALSHLNR